MSVKSDAAQNEYSLAARISPIFERRSFLPRFSPNVQEDSMNSSGFAIMLIIGIALFATGGGMIALGLMAIGGIGLVVSSFGSGQGRGA